MFICQFYLTLPLFICPFYFTIPPGLHITATEKMDKEGDWSIEKLLILIQKEVEARERANLQGSMNVLYGTVEANVPT